MYFSHFEQMQWPIKKQSVPHIFKFNLISPGCIMEGFGFCDLRVFPSGLRLNYFNFEYLVILLKKSSPCKS